MHAGKSLNIEETPTTQSASIETESNVIEDSQAGLLMTEEEQKELAISPCDACKAALEGACAGLIVGGVIVAVPEELTIGAVVLALTAAGLAFGADQVREWINEAVRAGIDTAKALAEFICKKAGVC